jgi:hypothetical protein
MATNKILSIPQWLLVATTSTPEVGYSAIYPKAGSTNGLTGSWYIIDEYGEEKRLAYDYWIGGGLSYSEVGSLSPYGYRLDVAIGGGLTYSGGLIPLKPISVWGITPSMLAITGSYEAGYVLSTSTVSGEFKWIQAVTTILGPTNAIPKFTGSGSLTASSISDNGIQVSVGLTSQSTYTFSVGGSKMNVGIYGQNSFLHFSDFDNNYIQGQSNGGLTIRTTDEFRVEVYTNSLSDYGVINFDNANDNNNTLTLLNNTFDFSDLTYSKYLSASNINSVRFGKTSSNFLLELYSNTQGAIKITDGGQASYSVLYSDSQGLGKWGKIYGYDGLTSSGLGVGLDLTNLKGLTYNGGTFGFDYTKFGAPLTYSSTGTISLATVSVATGVTYGSVFETPTFRLDQFGRITDIMTVSTSAFTGPQGPTGISFVWRGSYATSSTYSFYNVVEYGGSSYISTGTNSPGITPSTGITWSLMAARGATGDAGVTGQGFSWQGSYATSSTYSLYNVVYYEGSSYISLGTATPGLTPSSETQSWNIMALGSNTLNVTGTYGAVLVYGESGWTALGPGTAGWVLTSGGTTSLPYWSAPTGSNTMFGTFSQDFLVVLNEPKSFGKYKNGQIIPAATNGWTLEQFIYDVVTETLEPIVNVEVTLPTPGIPFGSTSSDNTVRFGSSMRNPGAVAETGVLERTTENPVTSTSWVLISNLTQSNNQIVDTVPQFAEYDVPTFYYRYTVVDSKGGSASAIDSVGVVPYNAPDITLTVTSKRGLSSSYSEQHLHREYGKVESVIDFTYDRQSELIDLNSFKINYKYITYPSTSTYITYQSAYDQSLPDTDTGTINRDHLINLPISKGTPTNITRMRYQVELIDERSQSTPSQEVTVSFYPLYFFGPVDAATWETKDLTTVTRADLLACASNPDFVIKTEYTAFTSGKLVHFVPPTYKVFLLVIPDNKSLSSIMKRGADGDASLTLTTVPGNSYINSLTLKNIESADPTFAPGYKIYRGVFASDYTLEQGQKSRFEITLS